jgi:NYN domain-containing protein
MPNKPVAAARQALSSNITSDDAAAPEPLRVGLLVDYPVLLRAVRASDPDAVPRLSLLVQRARTLGPVYVARAYGAWYDLDEALSAFGQGVDPAFVPPVGPGSAPTTTALVADGLTLIRTQQVQALALSGDDRLLPLVAAAHAEGLPVGLVAHSCLPDGPCLKLADFAEPAQAYARAVSRAERYRRSVA